MTINSSTQPKVKQHLRLAKQAENSDDIALAIKHYQAAIELDPISTRPIWAYLSLGRLLIKEHNFQLAEKYFKIALQKYPKDLRSFRSLAAVAVKQQKWELALKRWDLTLNKFPNNFYALIGRANALTKLKRYQEAESCFNQLDSKYPSHADGKIGLARLAGFQYQWSLALERWKEAKFQFPDNLNILQGYAEALVKLRHFDEARVCYEYISDRYKNDKSGFIGIAKLFMQQRQWSLALEQWNETLDKFPNDTDALKGRATVFCALHCFLEAEFDFQTLNIMYPNNVDGLIGLIDVAIYQKQWKIALERSQKAIKRFPENINAWYKKGTILTSLAEYKQAENIFKQIQQMSPDSPSGIKGLFEIAYHLEDFNLCESIGILSEKQFPELLSPLFDLTNLYFTIGETTKLESILNKIISKPELFQQISIYKEAIKCIVAIDNGKLRAGIDFFKQATENYNHHILLSLIGIKVVASILLQNRLDLIEEFLQIIYADIKKPTVAFRVEITSIIYQMIADYYRHNQKNRLAYLNYRKSIECNHTNFYSIKLLKRFISVQYSSIKRSLISKKTKNKIVIMIISCQKNQEIIPFLRKYLYQKLDLPYFFVIGNPNLSSEWHCESDILHVKASDTYNLLAEKILKSLECIYGVFDFKGILKFDDDVWIKNTDKFLSFVKWLENDCEADYFGRLVGTKGFMSNWMGRCYHWGRGESSILNNEAYREPNISMYCGGDGYYLSRKSISTLVEYYLKCPDTVYRRFTPEDKYMGETLFKHGIEPLSCHLSQFGLISEVDIKRLSKQYLAMKNSESKIGSDLIYSAIKR